MSGIKKILAKKILWYKIWHEHGTEDENSTPKSPQAPGSFREYRGGVYPPPILTALALLYAILPLLNVFVVFLRSNFRWRLALASFSITGILLLITAPIIAWGLYRVRRWAYRLFLLHAGVFIGYNVYFISTHPGLAASGSLVQSLFGLGLMWFFLRREVADEIERRKSQ